MPSKTGLFGKTSFRKTATFEAIKTGLANAPVGITAVSDFIASVNACSKAFKFDNTDCACAPAFCKPFISDAIESTAAFILGFTAVSIFTSALGVSFSAISFSDSVNERSRTASIAAICPSLSCI